MNLICIFSYLGTDVCLEDDGSVTNNCIGCICEASSRCDATIKCVSNGFLCGPFFISKPFWIDAGRCVLPGDNPENEDGNYFCVNFVLLRNSTLEYTRYPEANCEK